MQNVNPVLIILFRWLHIVTACIAVGGVFFLRIILPIAAGTLEESSRNLLLARTCRVFKMVTHTCILLFIISGTYNAVMNWGKYSAMGSGLGHSLFGTHLLLALVVMGLLLWMFLGKAPRGDLMKWLAVTLGLMLLTVASASVLKYARDTHAMIAGSPLLESGKP